MDPRVREMGKASLAFHADLEFRTKLRAMIASNVSVDVLKQEVLGYFERRGLSRPEALVMTGMYSSGGYDAATVIGGRTR